jgi:hypothetical protein
MKAKSNVPAVFPSSVHEHDNAQLGDSEKIFPPVSQHLSIACDELPKNIFKNRKDPHFHQNGQKMQRL